MKQIIENLNTLRSGIFKDEKAVNDLLDATIELAEQRIETASAVDAIVIRRG